MMHLRDGGGQVAGDGATVMLAEGERWRVVQGECMNDTQILTPRAVNVGDFIARFGPLHPAYILLRPLLTMEQVDCERGVLAGLGILVRDDVSDERWGAVMQILRAGLGQFKPIPKTTLRIYEKRKGKGWVRV